MARTTANLAPSTNKFFVDTEVQKLLLKFAEDCMKSGKGISVLSQIQLVAVCKGRGIRVTRSGGQIEAVVTMREYLHEEYKERHPYDHLDIAVLRRMHRQRDLQAKSGKACDIISALEVADKRRRFRFSDLPPELRISVYELVFSDTTVAERSQVFAGGRGYIGYGYGPGSEHSVTRVCHLMRAESKPVFSRVRRIQIAKPFSWNAAMKSIADLSNRDVQHLNSMLSRSVTPKIRSYGIRIEAGTWSDKISCVILHLHFRPEARLPKLTVVSESGDEVLHASDHSSVKILRDLFTHFFQCDQNRRVRDLLRALSDTK